MGIVVLNAPVSTGVWVQGSSYIGYDNALLRSDGVVVPSAEDAGFPATNATSWLITGGGWQITTTDSNPITLALTLAAAENFNSYGIYKHNLGDLTATIKLQHSSDGSSWTDLTGSEKNIVDNKAIFFVGTGQTALYWRLHISAIAVGETMTIGQAFVGPSLAMFSPPEPGFTPPNLALNNKYISSRADGGDFLGRSLIRRGSKTGFSNSVVHKDWVRANWQDVMEAIEKTPFYYGWDTTNYPSEVAFCFIEKKIAVPTYVNSAYFSLNLDFIALIE